MRIAVCWKWFTREAGDARWAGVSAADEAALETALALRETATGPTTIDVATESVSIDVLALAPPVGDDVLRTALAVGVDRVIRIDADTRIDSRVVAGALAEVAVGADLVLCGDYSPDRGTGSVPAFLAARLGAAQALGLVDVDTTTPPTATTPMRAVRRLDAGRREVIDVTTPAVLSLEGSVASLRRAPLAAVLSSKQAPIEVVAGPVVEPTEPTEPTIRPYRPLTRILPAPEGTTLGRVRDILDIGGDDAGHAEWIDVEPSEAATRILAQLTEWGYLDRWPGR